MMKALKSVVRKTGLYLTNVFLKVLIFKKRDKTVWIFGAWKGKRYADNSKYFFEYVLEHMPNIRAVWITKNPSVKKELSESGVECYLYNEKKARALRAKAGFIFYTNGMADIGDVDLGSGAVKVALWHGMPLKKIYYASNNLQKRNENFIRQIQFRILKIYNNSQRSLTIATSKQAKDFLIECFDVKPKTVLITGQPRNDVLFNENIRPTIYDKLNHANNEQFILYMPTWRESSKKGKPFLNTIIKELYQDDLFIEKLKRENIKLYIKPHPNVFIDYKSNGNIIILEPEQNIDTQELIASTDILITDYSSVFIDYALTERPIHFFVPDKEEYANDRLGLFLEFEELADYWFGELDEFKKVVFNSSTYQEKGMLNTNKINRIYNDSSLEKGQYSKILLEHINKIL